MMVSDNPFQVAQDKTGTNWHKKSQPASRKYNRACESSQRMWALLLNKMGIKPSRSLTSHNQLDEW